MCCVRGVSGIRFPRWLCRSITLSTAFELSAGIGWVQGLSDRSVCGMNVGVTGLTLALSAAIIAFIMGQRRKYGLGYLLSLILN